MKSPRNIGCMNELRHGIMIRHHRKRLRLVSLDDSKGDQHRDGRSVLIATFNSGFRIVYKPRPLAVAMHFQELLNWLNDRGAEPPLRTIRILDRGAYGWIEFIAPQGCGSGDEVRRFYARQGEYLALLYALEATDFHYENVIAVGEHPILVDLETFSSRASRIATKRSIECTGTLSCASGCCRNACSRVSKAMASI